MMTSRGPARKAENGHALAVAPPPDFIDGIVLEEVGQVVQGDDVVQGHHRCHIPHLPSKHLQPRRSHHSGKVIRLQKGDRDLGRVVCLRTVDWRECPRQGLSGVPQRPYDDLLNMGQRNHPWRIPFVRTIRGCHETSSQGFGLRSFWPVPLSMEDLPWRSASTSWKTIL
jgi:hypothetical protein